MRVETYNTLARSGTLPQALMHWDSKRGRELMPRRGDITERHVEPFDRL